MIRFIQGNHRGVAEEAVFCIERVGVGVRRTTRVDIVTVDISIIHRYPERKHKRERERERERGERWSVVTLMLK